MTNLFGTWLLVTFIINTKGRSLNNETVLTSSYAQVSRWGSGSRPEGRSNAGQTPWTQSATAHVVRGQNLSKYKKNHRDSPHYVEKIEAISNKKGSGSEHETIPGKGEVMQERFNPRPWFGYEATGSKPSPMYIPPAKPSVNNPPSPSSNLPQPQPDFVYATPDNSFPKPPKISEAEKPSPVLKPPYGNDDKPPADSNSDNFPDSPPSSYTDNSDSSPTNLYNSPFSSYNPPPHKLPGPYEQKNPRIPNPEYLPPQDEMNNPPKDSYQPPSEKNPGPYTPKIPDEQVKIPYEYNPPQQESDEKPMEMSKEPTDDADMLPPDTAAPESLPPYLHYNPKGHYHDHHPPVKDDDTDLFHAQQLPSKEKGHGYERPPSDYQQPQDDDDTNNTPPQPPEDFGKLPEYLDHDPHIHGYNFDHLFPHGHHHIYHEVQTTTPAPENERLNKRPYSYYYLGRKLWYIPLYFSVYFIIYIFVLILKSIARHKITFNHYFEDDKREMKDMHDDHINGLSDHVMNGMNAARRKYVM